MQASEKKGHIERRNGNGRKRLVFMMTILEKWDWDKEMG